MFVILIDFLLFFTDILDFSVILLERRIFMDNINPITMVILKYNFSFKEKLLRRKS